MKKEQNITKLIISMPIVFIIFTILSSIYISVTVLQKHYEEDLRQAEFHELDLQKQFIKNQIDSMYNYIKYKKSEATNRLRKDLKEKVYTAYDIAHKIYEEKKDTLNEKELQKEILESLRKVRYGKDGYYFIAHMKGEKEIISKMLPATPHAENINAYNLKDEENNYYVRKFVQSVKTNINNEGYVRYKWIKLTDKKQYPKISFVKLFEPYDWFIGYGEYFDTFEEKLKKEAIDRLNRFTFGDNGYIWTHDINHNLVQHPYRKESIGKNDYELEDSKGTKIIRLFVKEALANKDGTYVEYYWNKPNSKEHTKKIGYIKYIPDWDWVIGTGVYVDDVNKSLKELVLVEEKEINESILSLLTISLFMLLSSVIISLIISNRVNEMFFSYQERIEEKTEELEEMNQSLESKVEEKTKELKKLNEELEERIEEKINELNEKNAEILEQSKMVALGEMIGNIAHQWRQPLSAITTAASGIKIKKELDMLSDDELLEFSQGIVDNSKYLSQVIEDFKNYIKAEKFKEDFNINEPIRKSLSIFDSSIHNHNLTLKTEFSENIIVDNYQNELVQALVNIVNNAKDALKERTSKEEDRIILIKSDSFENKAVISIQDSAGGIPDEVMPKIFEPYFTTKDKSQGTGLGLYMTYKIIVDSMDGEIEVKNKEFVYENKTYKGAEFKILLDRKI